MIKGLAEYKQGPTPWHACRTGGAASIRTLPTQEPCRVCTLACLPPHVHLACLPPHVHLPKAAIQTTPAPHCYCSSAAIFSDGCFQATTVDARRQLQLADSSVRIGTHEDPRSRRCAQAFHRQANENRRPAKSIVPERLRLRISPLAPVGGVSLSSRARDRAPQAPQ